MRALNTQGVGKSYFRLKSPFILEMARDGPSVTTNINKKSGCLVVRDNSDDTSSDIERWDVRVTFFSSRSH